MRGALLVAALTLFVGLGLGAGLLRLGLLLGDLALVLGLVLLGASLAGHVVLAGHRPDGLLRLALQAFDDTLDAFAGATVIRHGLPPDRSLITRTPAGFPAAVFDKPAAPFRPGPVQSAAGGACSAPRKLRAHRCTSAPATVRRSADIRRRASCASTVIAASIASLIDSRSCGLTCYARVQHAAAPGESGRKRA